MNLAIIKKALLCVSDKVFHFDAMGNIKPPYIVWAEDGEETFHAQNRHEETAATGTIDLYTKDEDDLLISQIPQALNDASVCWYKNSVQFERETGLIHHEWVFEV